MSAPAGHLVMKAADVRWRSATAPKMLAVVGGRVLDGPELLEFVHEEVHARARRADHLRERFLRDPWDTMVLIRLAVPRQQQQGAGQPLLAGIEHCSPRLCLGKQTARVRHSTRLSSVLLAAALATSASCRRRVADCTPLHACEPVQ
jgi:hypothetical protein